MTRGGKFERDRMVRARRVSRAMAVLLLLLILAGAAAVMRDEIAVAWYARAMKDARVDEWAVMQKMVDAGPAGARWVIHHCRRGSADGEVERLSAAMLKGARYDTKRYLDPLFGDAEPRVRAYAVAVAGELGDKRCREVIAKLTGDGAELPEGWTDRTVSQRAHRALAALGD